MKTKEIKKLFNIQLPQTLIDYIKVQSALRYTSMSQYMVDLILKDKEEKTK
jgi:hypothetical protein